MAGTRTWSLVTLVGVAAFLPGCFREGGHSGGNDSRMSGDDLALTLDSIPEGSDLIQMTLYAPVGSTLRMTLAEEYKINTNIAHCYIAGFTSREIAWLGKISPFYIAASEISREPLDIGSLIDRGSFSGTADDILVVPKDGKVTVSYGYSNAVQWKSAGTQFNLHVLSDTPFQWEISALGSLDCTDEIVQYEGGSFYVSPVLTYASEVRHEFVVNHVGMLLFAPDSDLGFSFSLENESELILTDAKAPQEHANGYFVALTAGRYRLTIHEIMGTQSVRAPALVIDCRPASTQDVPCVLPRFR